MQQEGCSSVPDVSVACREEQLQDNDEDVGPGDLTGVVSGHAGEFFCPTCRRISNALLPGASTAPTAASHQLEASPPEVPIAMPTARLTGKRKLDDSSSAGMCSFPLFLS